MAPITVQVLAPEQDEALTHFLDQLGRENPAVLGYHYPFYRDMLTRTGVGEPFTLGAYQNGELAGMLPGFFRTTPVGTVYNSLPFFGPNAGVLAKETCADDAHRLLIGAVLDEIKTRQEPLSASFYTPFGFHQYEWYDRALPGALIVEKFTQYLLLEQVQWDKKIRYDLRRAESAGLKIETDISTARVEEFYTIYAQNCTEYGIPLKPRPAVEYLFGQAGMGRQVRACFGLLDDRMAAGLMVIYGPQTVSYYIPCTLPEARPLQPMTALIDQAVQQARQAGVKYWNWESSPVRGEGVYNFKKKWGSLEGRYRIYVVPMQPVDVFESLGRDGITASFPYYFVYPFDRMAK